MGQQGAHVCDVIFDNVRVPVENRPAAARARASRWPCRCCDRGRLHISAVCVGVAERLLADCVAYASERKQFGQAISELPAHPGHDRRQPRPRPWSPRPMTMETARTPRRRQERHHGGARGQATSPPRWSAASPTARCRSSAARAMWPTTGSSASTATCASSAIYEGTSQIQQVVIARETLKRGG